MFVLQVKGFKEGKAADKPIYNHVTGLLDPAETVQAPQVSDMASSRVVCSLGGGAPCASEHSEQMA